MKYLIALLLSFSWIDATENPQVVSERFVSPQLDNFDCHSSSIIATSQDKLCVVWKSQNVGIWASIFENGAWSAPEPIVSAPDSVCWSPVLTKRPNGELLLFYRLGSDPRHTISLMKRSSDEGAHWSDAELLPAGIVGPTKTKPLFDEDGNMICGSSSETGSPDDERKATACWIEILSKDGQWSKYGPLEIPGKRFGCIEPALFLGKNGALKLLCRDRSNRIGLEGWIWTAESFDRGKTWSAMTKTSLPNPDSGVDAMAYRGDEIVLIYNHSHTNRYPLTLAISKDGGGSWTRVLDLESQSGEFPSITTDSEGLVHVTYAFMPEGKTERRIKHVTIDLHESLL